MNKNDLYKEIVQDKDLLDHLISKDCKLPGDIDPNGSYYIYSGGSGNGKTWDALAFAKHYMDQHATEFIWKSDFDTIEIKYNLLPNFVPFTRILDAAEGMNSFDSDTKAGALTLLYELQESPMLIIDDMWVEKKTDLKDTTLREYLYKVFNYRYNNRNEGLQTIVTSNSSPEEIEDFYREKLASRLMGLCELWTRADGDLRIQNKHGI